MVNEPMMVSGCIPPEKLTGLGNCSMTNNRFTSPGSTPAMLRPLYKFDKNNRPVVAAHRSVPESLAHAFAHESDAVRDK